MLLFPHLRVRCRRSGANGVSAKLMVASVPQTTGALSHGQDSLYRAIVIIAIHTDPYVIPISSKLHIIHNLVIIAIHKNPM